MSRRIPTILALACGAVASACAANAAQQGAAKPLRSEDPFGDVASLEIAPDTLLHSVKIRMLDQGQLNYPERARHDGVEAGAVVAFVIDTAGRIEPRTMTFLEPVPPFEFRRSLCAWNATVRFARPLVDGRPRRILVVQPFNFTLGENSLRSLRMPDTERYNVHFRSAEPYATVAYLKRFPHCSG